MNIIIAGDGEVGFYIAEALVDSNHNITIVDPYLFQNKSKLKNYILPSIKHGANLTFYTFLDRPSRSGELQSEFVSSAYSNWNIKNIYSVGIKKDIHDRGILTDKYFIHIGKGLAVFGNNGTEECYIHVYHRINWHGTLPTIDTTIM